MNILNIVVFYYAIGNDPTGLNIAIVNNEMPNHSDCSNSSLITTFSHNYTCDLQKISCRFVDSLSDEYYNKKFYRDFTKAYEDALRGKIYAIIYFARNFTESTQAVWANELDEYSPIIDYAAIEVHMDKTDFQLRIFFEKQIRSTYETYSNELLADCGYAIKLDSLPMQFEKPIYGKLEGDFKLMMGPIIVMTMMYFLSMTANITIITNDRSNGMWNRTLLSGVSRSEYILSHSFVMSLFNVITLLEIVLFLKLILKTDDVGAQGIITFLLFILSLSGMFTAYIIGCLADDQAKSYYLLHGMGVIIVTLSGEFEVQLVLYKLLIMMKFISTGIIWPIEAMPWVIQPFVYLFPVYMPAKSARELIIKGYGITDYSVYIGIVYSVVWMILGAIITLVVLKRKGFSRTA